jgi:hypothetical protein
MSTIEEVMRKIFIVLGFTLVVAGCATTPTPADRAISAPVDRVYSHQEKLEGESGILVVTRDSGFVGSGCFIGVYIDGELAAKFDPRETTKFYVPIGERIIGIGNPGGAGLCGFEKDFRREISTIVKSGDIKRFRVVIRPGDGAAIEATTM